MTFQGQDRQRARFLAEYSDEIVAERRDLRDAVGDDDDTSLRGLLRLVDELNAIRTPPPASLRLLLLQECRKQALDPLSHPPSMRARLAEAFVQWTVGPRRLHSALSLGVLAMVVAVVFLARPPAISAAEVLSRADHALAALVGTEEVLHRRQRVIAITTRGGDVSTADQIVDEWVDGADNQRLAARGTHPGGVVLWRYAAAREGEEVRPYLHFSPPYNVGETATGELLLVRPTPSELQRALLNVPPDRRGALARFLHRRYIYEPVVGDQRYNAILLDQRSVDTGGFPRVRLSMHETADAEGEPIYRVRLVEPSRLWHHWGRTAPVVDMASCETVLDITRPGLLTKKAQVACAIEDGRAVTVERTLLSVDVLQRSQLPSDVFTLDVAPHVPVRRQSAAEELGAFAAALDRVESKTSALFPRR